MNIGYILFQKKFLLNLKRNFNERTRIENYLLFPKIYPIVPLSERKQLNGTSNVYLIDEFVTLAVDF